MAVKLLLQQEPCALARRLYRRDSGRFGRGMAGLGFLHRSEIWRRLGQRGLEPSGRAAVGRGPLSGNRCFALHGLEAALEEAQVLGLVDEAQAVDALAALPQADDAVGDLAQVVVGVDPA